MGQDMNSGVAESRTRQSSRRIQKIRNLLIDCHENGLNYSETAKKLNDHGFMQFSGDRWNKSAVKKYVGLIFGTGDVEI